MLWLLQVLYSVLDFSSLVSVLVGLCRLQIYTKPKTPNPYRSQDAQGFQKDGEGRVQACLIKTQKSGTVPGKFGARKAWYAYNGVEHTAAGREIFSCNDRTIVRDTDFKCVTALSGRPLPEHSPRPPSPHAYEHKKVPLPDGSIRTQRRPVWAVLALDTPHGNIPGKVLTNGKCYYSYGGRQYKADRYAYIPVAGR